MEDFTLADLKEIAGRSLGAKDTPELTEETLDTGLVELGYDSLAVYELVTMLQDELGVRIADEEIEDLRTPRAVIELVSGRLPGAGAPSPAPG